MVVVVLACCKWERNLQSKTGILMSQERGSEDADDLFWYVLEFWIDFFCPTIEADGPSVHCLV